MKKEITGVTYTDPNGLVEWKDWVDIYKIKVPRYANKDKDTFKSIQYYDLPEGKYIIYRTGASWLNGKKQDILGKTKTEQLVGKAWPYIINTNYGRTGKAGKVNTCFNAGTYIHCNFVTKNKKHFIEKIHILVMKAFYPKFFTEAKNPWKLVTHHEGDKHDYRISKLKVVTQSHNALGKNKIAQEFKKIQEVYRQGFSQGGAVGRVRSPFYNSFYGEDYIEKNWKKLKDL